MRRPQPVGRSEGRSHRIGPDGRLRGRPEPTEIEQGREIRALAQRFDLRHDGAADDTEAVSWARAAAALRSAADALDGGERVRIELTPEEGRMVIDHMNAIAPTSSLSYSWRRGLTYVHEGDGYCDLVSTRRTHGGDVVEAIGWAAERDPTRRALLAAARAKIVAHQRAARAVAQADGGDGRVR